MATTILSVSELCELLQKDLAELVRLRGQLYYHQIDPETDFAAMETANRMGGYLADAEKITAAIKRWADDPATD